MSKKGKKGKAKPIARLPMNPADPCCPGPTHRPDGSRISKEVYTAPRQGQTLDQYSAMLRRMPPSMMNGLRGDGWL